MKDELDFINKIKLLGGQVSQCIQGSSSNSLLFKMNVSLNQWYFTAWFNIQDDSFRSPCYRFGQYKGILNHVSINKGIELMNTMEEYYKTNQLEP